MAADDEVAVSSAGSELKYLAFVKVVFLQATAWTLKLYGASKALSSGALQTVASRVAAAVTVLIVPVFITKLKGLPDKVLHFLDNKIDALAEVCYKCSPSLVKKVVGAALNATQPAIVAVQVAGVNGPRAAMRYIVGEIYKAIQSLFTKFRQFLLALLMKTGQYLMSKLTALLLEAIKTPTVQKAVVALISTVIASLGVCNRGITGVLGGTTSAMYKGSAALSWVPVFGGASKAAAGVASAAQTTLSSAVEKSVGALTVIQLAVEPAKPVGLTDGTVT